MTPEIYKIRSIGKGSLSIMPKPASGEQLGHAVQALKNSGVTKIVSLMETAEAETLGLANEAKCCASYGIQFLNYPIVDLNLPADDDSFIELANQLHAEIQDGAHTAIHCRAGIGRSGILTTSILIATGMSAELAFSTVSGARKISVPDTDEQREYVISISHRILSLPIHKLN